jgi:hypothetical protein
VEPREEIAGLAAELPGLRPAPPDARCSGYYVAEPGRLARTLLDHFFPAAAMREAGAVARVSGFCASLGCPDSLRGSPPAAWERLSDHCPVLLDLEDRALDGS